MASQPSTGVDNAAAQKVLAHAVWRLLPFLGLLYFVSFLDRVNVGYAALTMNKDLGLSASAYGFGAGIFFIGYFLFEVPSNFLLAKVGARAWIARIMISWGVLSAATAFAWSPLSFYVIRFLLGVAEAGFFPGVILYLTYWFPSAIRGRIMGGFLLAVPISSAVGAPISTAIIGLHAGGLHGWQWLFLLEGVPALLLGFVVMVVLPNGPGDARWLQPEEAASLTATLEAEAEAITHAHGASFRAAMRRPVLWRFAAIYFCIVTGLYGLGFWLPQIIKGFGGLDNRAVGLIAAIPYLLGALAMYLWAKSSDARQERALHVAIPAALGAVGLVWAGYAGSPLWSMVAIVVGSLGVFASLAPFWSLPTAVLSGSAAAGGIALINSIGNLSGYLAPQVIGVLKDRTGGYAAGLWAIGGAMALAAVLSLFSVERKRE